jgi:SAM-dependent methyltransferase
MDISLCCPECRSHIHIADEAVCDHGHIYRIRDGFIDFVDAPAVDARLDIDHECEAFGLTARVEHFFAPWLIQTGARPQDLRVLDDGCGNGQAVKRLVDLGFNAYGIDPGQRSSQWGNLGIPQRLFIADGTRLPFADASFDAVVSSGVIEHLGEELVPTRKEQDGYKQRYLHEVARILKPGGRAQISAPNGAFPIDFWHTGRLGIRVHIPYEHWMPNSFAVRRWVRTSPVPISVRFLSPEGYFAFERVRKYWYGRAFGPMVESMMSMFDRHPKLSASAVSPVLIAELSRAA